MIFLAFFFFAVLAGSAYFAVRLIIAHIKKQDKKAYLKKLGIAFATGIFAFTGFALTQAAKQARIVAEQNAFQNWNAKIQQGIEAVDDHWEQLWQYTLNDLSNGSIDVQTAFLTLRDLEHKLIDDEMIFYNANVSNDVSSQNRDAMNKVRQGLQAWAQARRKACEKFRISLGSGNLNETTLQETMDMINTSNAVMLRSAAELAVLQNKFGTP